MRQAGLLWLSCAALVLVLVSPLVQAHKTAQLKGPHVDAGGAIGRLRQSASNPRVFDSDDGSSGSSNSSRSFFAQSPSAYGASIRCLPCREANAVADWCSVVLRARACVCVFSVWCTFVCCAAASIANYLQLTLYPNLEIPVKLAVVLVGFDGDGGDGTSTPVSFRLCWSTISFNSELMRVPGEQG